MAKEWARDFYNSPAWKKTSRSYAKSVGKLCEECRRRGIVKAYELVHHKTWLTPENIGDPAVTLSWSNLEAVCRDCHARIHEGPAAKRWTVDEFGRVRAVDDAPLGC